VNQTVFPLQSEYCYNHNRLSKNEAGETNNKKTIFHKKEGKKHLQRVLEALIAAYGKTAVIMALQELD
tara:strand:- start:270 stop:473 length:204 start_codon:yes stop_codon:yes gene_type:complete